jgi:hypothetical protein
VTTAEIIAKIEPEYLAVRELEDGSIAAVGELLYTRAIFLGCDEYGFSRRFCFQNRTLALLRFAELRTEDDVPQGAIARRGDDPRDPEPSLVQKAK